MLLSPLEKRNRMVKLVLSGELEISCWDILPSFLPNKFVDSFNNKKL